MKGETKAIHLHKENKTNVLKSKYYNIVNEWRKLHVFKVLYKHKDYYCAPFISIKMTTIFWLYLKANRVSPGNMDMGSALWLAIRPKSGYYET